MGAPKINHSQSVGKKFNRLTVNSYYVKGKYCYYNCTCDCGTIKDYLSFSLLNGTSGSCGCYHKSQVSKLSLGKPSRNRKPDGETAFNYLWHTYNRNARKREVEFLLTREEFKALTKLNCKYCGQEPNRAVKHFTTKRNKSYSNPYLHNGVDRVNNNKGYTLENSVACCRTCNVAKGTQTKEEFMSWVKKIYEFTNV